MHGEKPSRPEGARDPTSHRVRRPGFLTVPRLGEHAPLSGLDEFLVHNSPYPVRVMWTPDAQAYERMWFTCQDRVGELLMVIGLAFYPNLGTAEAFAIVNVRGQHSHGAGATAPLRHRPDLDWTSGRSTSKSSSPSGSGASGSTPTSSAVAYDLSWFDTKRPVFRQLGAGMIVGRGLSALWRATTVSAARKAGSSRPGAFRGGPGDISVPATTTGAQGRRGRTGALHGGMQHPHSGEWVEFEDLRRVG